MRAATILKAFFLLLVLAAAGLCVAAVQRPDAVPWAARWVTPVKQKVVEFWRGPQAPDTGAKPAARNRVVAEGRVVTYPGCEVMVSAEIAGAIVEMKVRELDAVHKGDVLAQLRCDDTKAQLEETRAKLAEYEAEMKLAEWRVQRFRELMKTTAASQDELHQWTCNAAAAGARRSATLAAIQQLEAVIAKSTIRSPIDGTVILRSVDAGEMVSAGQALVTVADLGRTRIEAEVDEFDSGRVALGAEAYVTADGFPGQKWKARVEEVPSVVVARRLKPEDPSRPTDTRVLLAKLVLQEPAPLKLGQRVEIEIDHDAETPLQVTAGRIP